MQRHSWQLALTLAVVTVLAVWRASPAAEQTSSSQGSDTLAALLVEVRGLRAAMEQMASAGPRVQLAMGRLQLQEQRINTLLRQVETIRGNLADKQRHEREMTQQLMSMADEMPNAKPDVRQAMEEQTQAFKRELTLLSPEILRLQAEETALSQQIANEQGRWSDINKNLEDLERALARR
jgi:chromosome segregation ATPase